MLDALLGRFRPYRRLRGGHWEGWYVGDPASLVWHRMLGGCANRALGGTASRPWGAHGTPTCETWS